MFTNKWFSSLSIKNDCERKKKDTWWDITWHAIRLSQHLPFKMAAELSRTTTLTCKAFLVVNHPEIALTLEKCWLNCRIPCHLFACHWIRMASIVLCFVLQRTPTNENNGGTEWRGIQQLLKFKVKSLFASL